MIKVHDSYLLILFTVRIDIAEAQTAQIVGLLLTFFLGPEVWNHKVRVLIFVAPSHLLQCS